LKAVCLWGSNGLEGSEFLNPNAGAATERQRIAATPPFIRRRILASSWKWKRYWCEEIVDPERSLEDSPDENNVKTSLIKTSLITTRRSILSNCSEKMRDAD
jgi:hypothetical protein